MITKTIRKILVPLDGSPRSLRGLDFALSIAKSQKATITGLHVVSQSLAYGIPIPKEMRKKSQKKGEQIISEAEKRSKKRGFILRSKIQFGYPRDAIVKFAHKGKFDLIVIGSRGPNPGVEMFLGSVSHYVIHKSKIPVTIVK